MKLTAFEREMLDGKHGEIRQLAMNILCDLGDFQGAEKFVEVTFCHSDNAVYMGDAAADFVELLGNSGAKLTVPTTTHAGSCDMQNWYKQMFDPKVLNAIHRIEAAHNKMGAIPTWTCAPYQAAIQPTFGQQIVSANSNVVCYYNSVVGARTNRYAGPLELLGAIAGRVPYVGLHVKENRYAEGLVRLGEDIKKEWFEDETLFSLIAYVYGSLVGNRVWAIEGMPVYCRTENLRDFGTTAASSGGIAMYHMIGITPEAQTREMAFNGNKPKYEAEITLKDIVEAEQAMTNNKAVKDIDVILLGCPHLSFEDCRIIARMFRGRRVNSNIEFTMQIGRDMANRLKDCGLYEELNRLGITIYQECCALEFRAKERGVNTMMSNSGKFAIYGFGLSGIQPVLGSLRECVETAVAGRLVKEKKPWRK